MGRLRIGVRSSTREMDAVVRQALAGHVVNNGKAPPNLSLLSPETGSGVGRGVWFVYRSGMAVARRRTVAGAVRAVAAQLEGFAPPPPAVRARLDAVVLTSGDRVVIAPAILRANLAAIETRLRRAGWAVADMAYAGLDADGHLVVAHPAVAVDERVLADLEAPAGSTEVAALAAGAHRITAWMAWGTPDDYTRVRPAQTVASQFPAVNLDGGRPEAALSALAAAAGTTSILAIASLDPEHVVARLKTL